MDVLKLTEMTSVQLMSLFVAVPALPLSQRARKIIDELEQRSYIFDVRVGDFVTCGEWNARHSTHMPIDCSRCETVILTRRAVPTGEPSGAGAGRWTVVVTVADAERVYAAIDERLKTTQTLPTQRQIAQTLGMKEADVGCA